MAFTYRGIHYTPSTEVKAPRTVRLTYRGVTFNHTGNPVLPARQIVGESVSRLTYRGVTYLRPATSVVSDEKSRAIHWRFQGA